MENILILGSSGQLGKCIREYVYNSKNNMFKTNYIFIGHDKLDVTDKFEVINMINTLKPNVVINCAAYTNVESAEENKDLAYDVNSTAVDNIAYACFLNNAYLIHISTDFVFDGTKSNLYTEDDNPNPINVYGESKYDGEISALCYNNSIIIRTSWLYSEYGKNFFNTMYNKITNNEDIRVVDDQYGSPTNAHDLAEAIVDIIENKKYENNCGIYQFSNKGVCSWHSFAREIAWNIKKDGVFAIYECSSKEYKCKAKRPSFSAMSTEKFENTFNIKPKKWEDSLEELTTKIGF